MSEPVQTVIQSTDLTSLQVVIDTIPIATFIIGPQGDIIDCNKSTLMIFGAANRNEIIGKTPDILAPRIQRNGNDSGTECQKKIQLARTQKQVTFYFDHQTLSRRIFLAKVTLSEIIFEGQDCLITTIEDMTGQVRVEELNALINNNPHPLISLNPDGTISDVNPTFLQISGYSREEWIGKNHKDFPVIQRDGLTVDDVLRKKESVSGKITVNFPKGIKMMDYSYVPVFDEDGNLIRIFDIITDLTNLVEKIQEADSLVTENPASILTIDPTGKILSVNPSFITISHLTKEKILSMRLQDFNILEKEGDSFTDCINSKKTARGKLVVDFGWSVKIFEYTYIPIINTNGDLARLTAMYVDVSDLVSYVDEIKTFIHENPHAILTMTPDMHFTDVNPAFSQIMGYTREESLRMKLTDVKIIEREGQSLQDAIRLKKPVNGRIIADCPSGIKHLDYVYIPIFDKKGNVVRFLEIFSDMTAIRSLVKYLEQSVEIVQNNISCLAKGDTTFTITILNADEHSVSARNQFVKIGEAMDTARKAIAKLVHDSNTIVENAIAGNMMFRSDVSVHEGDYRAIIQGMNSTLDSIKIPVREAMKIANEYAKYNFIIRFDPKLDIKGDWIPFKEALNNIGIQVTEAISLINKNISDLAANSEEANASIEEVLAGTHQITINTSKVSQNANQGEEGILQVLKAMEDLNVTVGSVSRKAESVSVSSNEANSFAKEGIHLATKSENAMGEITKSTVEVGSIINDINSQMAEIGKIVRLISDIANQTNLLALNAAIEAARAGEAGRGFAVVAAEVKSLAQDSRKSAENIADMISTLQSKANQAVGAMGRSTSAVQDGSASLGQTMSAFNQIADTIEEINQNIIEVASASEEQAASVEEVTASIQEVSNLIQNTSHEAGDTAAATEEAAASIDEIGRIMGGVVSVVDDITKEMSKFKVL